MPRSPRRQVHVLPRPSLMPAFCPTAGAKSSPAARTCRRQFWAVTIGFDSEHPIRRHVVDVGVHPPDLLVLLVDLDPQQVPE